MQDGITGDGLIPETSLTKRYLIWQLIDDLKLVILVGEVVLELQKS